MADVSVSLANMSVADTTATDDGKADKDDAQRDTSDDEESPEVVRVEQVVRGATRTRFGRQAKTISYAESSDEDEEEESFVLDENDEAASSDEDFASAEEEEEYEEEQQEDLSKLTVPALKARLKEHGAPVGGKKAELIARLTTILAEEEVTKAAAEEAVVEEAVGEEANADPPAPPPPLEAPPVSPVAPPVVVALAEVVADRAAVGPAASVVSCERIEHRATGLQDVTNRSATPTSF